MLSGWVWLGVGRGKGERNNKFGYIASQKPVIVKMIYYDRLKHCHGRAFSGG